MSSVDQARALALALPGALERDHHGRPSFRVAGGAIFATLWDGEHMNVMVDEAAIRTYLERDDGGAYAEVWWGKRLAALRVTLALVEEGELGELLADAFENKGGRPERD
jgi:YjbR